MKIVALFATLLMTQATFALADTVVLKLVKEDIRSGQLINGKRSVESLNISTCNANSCELSFNYFVDGCSPDGDYCFDLECQGVIAFDIQTIESTLKSQECIDL